MYIQTVWGKSTSEYACIQIAPSIYHPTANVLNCTGKQGRNLPFDAIRITCKNEAAYIDLHYSEAVANIVSFSASATSTNDEVAKFETNNFIPIADAPEGETIVLTQALTVIPSGPVAIAAPPTWYDLPLADGFVVSGLSTYNYNQYCKDQFGRVTVRLKCAPQGDSNILNGTIVATLPEGFRPPANLSARNYIVHDDISGKLNFVTVNHNGEIKGQGYDHSGFSELRAELSFYAAAD